MRAIILAVVLVLAPVAALAQDASPPPTGFDDFVATVVQAAFALLTIIVTGGIGWLGVKLNQWFGIQLDAAARDTLHSAALTGLRAALDRFGQKASTLADEFRDAVLASAAAWIANTGAPDAVRRFGLTPEEVARIAASKLPVAASEEPVVIPPLPPLEPIINPIGP